MKRIILSLTIFLVSNLIIAQNFAIDDSRRISVTGSAEMIVAPDEIELEIILKEDRLTANLSAIETKFIDILKKHNIDTDEQELMFGTDYHWYYWWHYKRKNYKQKTYKIKLDCSTDLLSLIKDLDYQGIYSLRISNSFNENIQEFRKEVKISAMKAAKEKAAYLLESIDEQVGKVISVEEMPENPNHHSRGNQHIYTKKVILKGPANDDIENVTMIKLRYEVKAKFEIQ